MTSPSIRARGGADFAEQEHGEPETLTALEALNESPRLALLGGPGSGKSAFANFVALCMAGELLGSQDVNLKLLTSPPPGRKDTKDAPPKPQTWVHAALIPVQIILRDLAAQLPNPGVKTGAETIWNYLTARLEQAALGAYAPHLHEELLSRGGLILLDGLDEVPEADTRREQIKQAVLDFVTSFSRCRFLVTSRIYAYQKQAWQLDGFETAELTPFGQEQIERFVGAWFDYMAQLARLTPDDARGRAALLKQAITRNERLTSLAGQPLLLTMMARLQTERGNRPLPERREELYSQVVEMLLNQWEGLKTQLGADGKRVIEEPGLAEYLETGREEIRRALDKLAFEAHRDQLELKGTADISQGRLMDALTQASKKESVKPKLLAKYVRDRAGLLTAHGEGVYQFPHRTIQEYLAACHLTRDNYPDTLSHLARNDPERWREAALLAAAKAFSGSPSAAWELVDDLLPNGDPPSVGRPAEGEVWGALLAGQVLRETGLAEPAPDTPGRNERKRRHAQTWVRAIVERGWHTPRERAAAGEILSLLGDERDFDALVSIPAGEFWMGDDGAGDASPRHRVYLRAFKIGKYPITNAQYGRFVNATGRPWPSYEARQAERRNSPALRLSWHDAMGYCAWLTGQWRQAGRIESKEMVALPSEAEWERAARYTDGRTWPWQGEWDEDRANTDESGIGATSAVGMFPRGVSMEGCLDMAGNAWEWTRSLWGREWGKADFGYPYNPQDTRREDVQAGDEVRRVLRGGSWFYARGVARCSVRVGSRPDDRVVNSGYRVIVAPVHPL